MDPSKAKLKEKLENNKRVNLIIDEDKPLKDLTKVIKVFLEKTQWFKTVKITNKEEEWSRYKKNKNNSSKFKPEFKFKDFPYDETNFQKTINQARSQTEKIKPEHLDRYGAEEITSKQMEKFFDEILEEINYYIELSSGIENEQRWKEISSKIWSTIDENKANSYRYRLTQIEKNEHESKDITPEEVKKMFEAELDRIDMEYQVELRNVNGCFNIPESQTVVVAKGEEGKRRYSEDEAKMLTVHELFHAVRAYNGFFAGGHSGFPNILGMHTPFYDRVEEGGAVYREKVTGNHYQNKEFDYLLRSLAAYELSQTDDFVAEFEDLMQKLISLGGSERRAYELITRNREALRHHIYLDGVSTWEDKDELDKLLIGKVNEKWADIFWKEANSGKMIQKPEIGSEDIF